MAALGLLQARCLIAHELGESGLSGQMIVETIKNHRKFGFDDLPEFTKSSACCVADLHKAHTRFSVLMRSVVRHLIPLKDKDKLGLSKY